MTGHNEMLCLYLSSDGFESCLTNAVFDQCDAQLLQSGVQAARQIQASPDCFRGGVPGQYD